MSTEINNKVEKVNSLWARVVMGISILLLVAGFVAGIVWRMSFPVDTSQTGTTVPLAQINEALIMLFAGGLGSGLYAIRAYLLHACDKKDFDPDYLPWYPFWMLLGALLSVVFYFALRGGLLFLTINGNQTAADTLNGWSLAAVGSLIGLFSKYALEKLRKVFLTIFGETEEEEIEKKEAQKPKPEEGVPPVKEAVKDDAPLDAVVPE